MSVFLIIPVILLLLLIFICICLAVFTTACNCFSKYRKRNRRRQPMEKGVRLVPIRPRMHAPQPVYEESAYYHREIVHSIV